VTIHSLTLLEILSRGLDDLVSSVELNMSMWADNHGIQKRYREVIFSFFSLWEHAERFWASHDSRPISLVRN
jgi:hypothetical protein